MSLFLLPAVLTFVGVVVGGWYLLKRFRHRLTADQRGTLFAANFFLAAFAGAIAIWASAKLEIGVVRVEAADPREVPPEVLGSFGLSDSDVGSVSYVIHMTGYVCAEFELDEPTFLAWAQRCGWQTRRFHTKIRRFDWDDEEYRWRVWDDAPEDDVTVDDAALDDDAELLIDGITAPGGKYVIVEQGYVAVPEGADLNDPPFQCQYDIAGGRLIYNGDRWPGS